VGGGELLAQKPDLFEAPSALNAELGGEAADDGAVAGLGGGVRAVDVLLLAAKLLDAAAQLVMVVKEVDGESPAMRARARNSIGWPFLSIARSPASARSTAAGCLA